MILQEITNQIAWRIYWTYICPKAVSHSEQASTSAVSCLQHFKTFPILYNSLQANRQKGEYINAKSKERRTNKLSSFVVHELIVSQENLQSINSQKIWICNNSTFFPKNPHSQTMILEYKTGSIPHRTSLSIQVLFAWFRHSNKV